jgi:hypothetical protein
MKRKAQIWTLDFAMSVLIFASALLSVMFAWNYVSSSAQANEEMKSMQLKVLTISDSLIRTPGSPPDWDSSGVEAFGLASSENVLDPAKVTEFIAMSEANYSMVRALLGITAYEFYFEVRDINGTVLGNTTAPVSPLATLAVPTERYCLWNDRIVKVKFVLWD